MKACVLREDSGTWSSAAGARDVVGDSGHSRDDATPRGALGQLSRHFRERLLQKSLLSACWLVMVMASVATSHGQNEVPEVQELVKRLQEVYSRQCCFRANFDQVTVNVAMDLRDRFEGVMYVKKPGLLALQVTSPERQQVVIHGRSYAVYFPADGNAVRGEIPPEMNVEHFFGFLANINELDRSFSIAHASRPVDMTENLYFLELTDRKNPTGTFRIAVGIDRLTFIIRRAIIYDALGNYNRFELSDITFLSDLPDYRFQIGPSFMGVKEPDTPRGQQESGNQ